MNDLLPGGIRHWHYVEDALHHIADIYGYKEIRTPLLEKTALFTQSIGDQTDIVEKEMYTFSDSSDESLSLRPEATASTVRACIQHGLLHNRQQRLWYMGPMFRRERPQKGRYRQFHQFGIEAFGWSDPGIDSEIIQFGERIWSELAVSGIKLEINTLGSDATRHAYRQELVSFLREHESGLDADSMRRMERNPLRILDSKDEGTRNIVSRAPTILDFLQQEERDHFDRLCESLDSLSISFEINPKLVRGLDYYTSTVFEWTTTELGAQSAVCAGGRYDSLVANRGGSPTPGIGFAMGLERLIELIVAQKSYHPPAPAGVYVVDVTEGTDSAPTRISEQLRNAGIPVVKDHSGGKLKSQLKRADQSEALAAIIIGQQELDDSAVKIKNLRDNSDQETVTFESVVSWCESNLKQKS